MSNKYVQEIFHDLKQNTDIVEIPPKIENEQSQYAFKENIERIRRVTLKEQRSRIQPCEIHQFVNFLMQWQHRTSKSLLSGREGIDSRHCAQNLNKRLCD